MLVISLACLMGPDAQGWMQGASGGYQSMKLSAGGRGNGASGLLEPSQVRLVDFCPLCSPGCCF